MGGRGSRIILYRFQREHGLASTLILDFCPRTVRQYLSVALSHPICDTLLQQPEDPQREEVSGQEAEEELGLAEKSGTESEREPSPGGVRVWRCGRESKTRDGLRKPILGGRKKEAIKGVGWFIRESDKNKRKQMKNM